MMTATTGLAARFAAAIIALSLTIAGCAGSYSSTPVGTLKGKLVVQWLQPDLFLFIPDQNDPLTFTRRDGTTIVPQRMLTDGGSVPRALWILRSYSPWGYAPAFIVHDWLFVMKQCSIPGNIAMSHHDAANVMAEVMKTMMEKDLVPTDKATLKSMFLAVDSPIAGKLWDEGKCTPPPTAEALMKKPIAEYELKF
jgi:Protein of unknown function (DUF1353)